MLVACIPGAVGYKYIVLSISCLGDGCENVYGLDFRITEKMITFAKFYSRDADIYKFTDY